MKIFFSGVENRYIKDLPKKSGALVSYDQPRQYGVIDKLHQLEHPVLLDSGAFATFNSGKAPKCPREYAVLIRKLKNKIIGAIAMDVIGGSVEDNKNNLNSMCKISGIKDKVWPVFHEGDSWDLMDYYLSEKYTVICLGAIESRGKQSIVQWLNKVFEKYPPCGFGGSHHYHGLAMTQAVILNEYKNYFYSVDSTSWLNLQKYGLKGGSYLLKNRTPSFYRKVGASALLDMVDDSNSGGKSIRHPEQISIFDWGI